MQEISKSALVPHACVDMYNLVTNIDAYPEFIQWCESAEVLEREEKSCDSTQVLARLGINYRGVKQSFTTQNMNVLNKSIQMSLHENADHWLKYLEGVWLFTDLGKGTKVELQVKFDIANGVLRRVVGPVFNHVVSSQLDAFVSRANALAND